MTTMEIIIASAAITVGIMLAFKAFEMFVICKK